MSIANGKPRQSHSYITWFRSVFYASLIWKPIMGKTRRRWCVILLCLTSVADVGNFIDLAQVPWLCNAVCKVCQTLKRCVLCLFTTCLDLSITSVQQRDQNPLIESSACQYGRCQNTALQNSLLDYYLLIRACCLFTNTNLVLMCLFRYLLTSSIYFYNVCTILFDWG